MSTMPDVSIQSATPGHDAYRDAATQLWKAVIVRAWSDAFSESKPQACYTPASVKTVRTQARDYITRWSRDLEEVCDNAEIDAHRLITAAKKELERIKAREAGAMGAKSGIAGSMSAEGGTNAQTGGGRQLIETNGDRRGVASARFDVIPVIHPAGQHATSNEYGELWP
ncbi:MAG: hypothetical protein AB7F96_05255 [Beijerinckiaceae bacterium]